jgi:predicted nucleotidyltransferase
MFEELLEKLASVLGKARIPYMVVGGQAVLLHGEPRLTRDIDITLGISTEQIDHFVPLVKTMGLEVLVDPHDFTRETMVLPCQETRSDIRVDFIFSFLPYERQAIERACAVKIGEAHVMFASVEDLVVHKVFAGRPRDLEDVKSVLIKNPGADLGYIRQWLDEFTEALNEPFTERFENLIREMEKGS